MDNVAHSEVSPTPPQEPKPALDNGLPEAHDETTQQIHKMSNFSVSEALGVPLLTKDIGKTAPAAERADRTASHPGALKRSDGYFAHFDSRDRLMAAMSALMILGPLFFGAMRG